MLDADPDKEDIEYYYGVAIRQLDLADKARALRYMLKSSYADIIDPLFNARSGLRRMEVNMKRKDKPHLEDLARGYRDEVEDRMKGSGLMGSLR